MSDLMQAVRDLALKVYGVTVPDVTTQAIIKMYAYFYSKGLSDGQVLGVVTWFYVRRLPGYNGACPNLDPDSDIARMLVHVIKERAGEW